MSTYEPGTVAVVTIDGEDFRAIRTGTPTNMGWEVVRPSSRYWVSDHSEFGRVADIRPLVVLDVPNIAGYADHLRSCRCSTSGTYQCLPAKVVADQIEAQTKPPRIPEPGWGEKVTARADMDPKRYTWLRYTANPNVKSQWISEFCSARQWKELIDPEAVSA